MYNYLKVTTSDFAYFPLLYKINKSDKSYKYFICHSLTYGGKRIEGENTIINYQETVFSNTVEEIDLVEYMADYIFEKIRGYLSNNDAEIVEIIDDVNILFKYDRLNNQIHKRMIFETKREYIYEVNIDNFDDFIKSRLNDSTHQFYELEAKKGRRYGVTSTT